MNDSIETQLFSWKDCDQIDTLSTAYYNVVLKVQIGDNPPGTHFHCVILALDQSMISLYHNGEEDDPSGIHYNLLLTIGAEQVKKEA